jgi:YD repeat-containing protein
MSNSYWLRDYNARQRANNLLHLKSHNGHRSEYLFLYVDEKSIDQDTSLNSPFNMLAKWNIDAKGPILRSYYKPEDAFASINSSSALVKLGDNLHQYASSQDEGMIFEDWQGTPGLNTITGLMAAHQNGVAIVKCEQFKTTSGQYACRVYKLQDNEGVGTYVLVGDYASQAAFVAAVHGIKRENGVEQTEGLPGEWLNATYNEVMVNKAIVTMPAEYVTYVYADEGGNSRSITAGVYIATSIDAHGYFFKLKDSHSLNNGGATENFALDLGNDTSFSMTGLSLDVDTQFLEDYYGSTDEVGNDIFTIGDIEYDASTELAAAIAAFDDFILVLGQGTYADGENTVVQTPIHQSAADTNPIGDPVNLVTGDYYQTENADIRLEAPGFPLEVTREYHSRLHYDGPFGYGWAWGHSERLLKIDDDTFTYYDSQQRPFKIDIVDGAYVYPPGASLKMTALAEGELEDLTSVAGWHVISRKDGSECYFRPDGFLDRKKDANGNCLRFAYDTSNRLTSITDTLNRTLQFDYNDQIDKIERVSDELGRSVHYVYGGSDLASVKAELTPAAQSNLDTALSRATRDDAVASAQALPLLGQDNDLVAVVDLAGNVTTYQYLMEQETDVNNHNLCQTTLPNGDYLELGYYQNDTTAYHRNKKGEVFNFQYSIYNRYGEFWNEEGYYRKVFWNENHDVTRITTEDGCVELKTYDANHNLRTHTDANGHTTTYTYDDRRNVLTKTRGTELWNYEYVYAADDFYRVEKLTVTDAKGNVTVSEFDTHGNLVSRTEPETDGIVSRVLISHDSYGNVQTVTRQESTDGGANFVNLYAQSESFEYDLEVPALLTAKIDRYGNRTEFFYDGSGTERIGLVKRVKDPAGYYTHLDYNEYGQKVRETQPTLQATDASDLPATQYRYNDNRQLLGTTAPDGGSPPTSTMSPGTSSPAPRFSRLSIPSATASTLNMTPWAI